MLEFETSISEIIQRTHNVKSFRFKTVSGAVFKPGQFFFVTIKINNQERTKHFSFSNSPTEKEYIEFTKRITISDFSNALNNLKTGDWARLKMPYGSFTFEGEYKKIAFISGGIGITPIRSMCKFIADTGISTDIALLYGNNLEEDIIFKGDLDRMALANKNIRIVYTLTDPGVDAQSWRGRTGLIDEAMIKREISDYKERIFYLCGPPKMVEGLSDILKSRLKVNEDNIKTENFTGY
ncbi:MAG: FAD-dependent oxidoreductase [Candidatus Omnitrophica bacterium]|nr:FAD-dependent oxidoreductase [Candidatus Omnitrophota bacterium]